MSRKYKFHNAEGIYFVSFAVINWIDVFVREEYFSIMADSLNFCVDQKGMVIYSWCVMPSHLHLIFSAREKDPSEIMRSLKTYTSKKLQKVIEEAIRRAV